MESEKELLNNNLYNPFKDISSLDQAYSVLSKNFVLYFTHVIKEKEDDSLLTYSKDKLINIYKKEFNDYKKKKLITQDKQFVNILKDYYKVSNGIINQQFCDIEKEVKNANDENDLLNKLNYETFKQESSDYYEISKEFDEKLQKNSNEINTYKLEQKKLNDEINTKNLIRNTYKKLGDLFDYFSCEILKKITQISKENFAIEEYSKTSLNKVENIHSLYNSIYNTNTKNPLH